MQQTHATGLEESLRVPCFTSQAVIRLLHNLSGNHHSQATSSGQDAKQLFFNEQFAESLRTSP